MSDLSFYIVDVFALEKYTGNQLAVFTEAGAISKLEMQQIAKEINYSETTFIPSHELSNGGYDVRIFTPLQELPFAGHPTLGTAYIIKTELVRDSPETIKLNLEAGQISVNSQLESEGEVFWMQQAPPTFYQQLQAGVVAAVLNIEQDEIDLNFPIQEVSTGVPFLIVPLKNLSTLKRTKLNKDKYFELINTTQAKSILVFCPETYDQINNLSVRVFAEYMGVPEDPATGSGNGCLAGYLVEHSYFGKESIDVRVEQGYEINRPSLLLLKAQRNQREIEVFVGGKVVTIAKGEFL